MPKKLRVVYKYPLIPGRNRISRIEGVAKVLHVGEQRGLPHVWIEHDAPAPITDVLESLHNDLDQVFSTVNIQVIATGEEFNPSESWKFINTVLMKSGLVFHFYQIA